MNKYILGIDGMACGMCEMHVEDKLRKAIKLKKVNASHIKNNVIVITELELSEEDFKKILDPTGYRITSYNKTIAVKKFFRWR